WRGGTPAPGNDGPDPGRPLLSGGAPVRSVRMRHRPQRRRHRGGRARRAALRDCRRQSRPGQRRHRRRADRRDRRAARAGAQGVRSRSHRGAAARSGWRPRGAGGRGTRHARIRPVRTPTRAGERMKGTGPLRLLLADEEATVRRAGGLAASQPGPAVIYLGGDLGAGKSTLARAWLRSLGVTGTIRSPTYTLVERYPLGDAEALHLDLYRIGSGAELEFLGLDEAPARLWLVEWPERGAGGLPPADLEIGLRLSGTGREAVLDSGSAAGEAWLAAMVEEGKLGAFPEP